jgi:hypothetical protein
MEEEEQQQQQLQQQQLIYEHTADQEPKEMGKMENQKEAKEEEEGEWMPTEEEEAKVTMPMANITTTMATKADNGDVDNGWKNGWFLLWILDFIGDFWGNMQKWLSQKFLISILFVEHFPLLLLFESPNIFPHFPLVTLTISFFHYPVAFGSPIALSPSPSPTTFYTITPSPYVQ